ncbi:MAG: efflux RND transporter periplasmic adaptor subunit [Saprospiraceae bacterium]|nr:efflux RND transporter periplasmic adaptor subunit [Saprospiraceae bacterium]
MATNNNKIFRKLSVLIGIGILVGGIFLSLKLVSKAEPQDTEAKDQTVGESQNRYAKTIKVQNKNSNSILEIRGKLVAKEKVDLFAEVTGILTTTGKNFREGVYFQKGETLFIIDDTEVRLDLKTSKSKLYSVIVGLLPDLEADYSENFQAWYDYVNHFDIEKPIQALPTTKSEREKLYIAARGLENQYLGIKQKEHRLTKYKIQAPFSGVLTNALIYEGGLIRAGQPLGTLMNANNYELEATVSLADAKFLSRGSKVVLYSDVLDKEWKGSVARFGKTMDVKTQTQKVFISVSGSQLNEGMYLNGKVKAEQLDNVIELSRRLVIDGNQVYIVDKDKLKLLKVEVLRYTDNQAIVRGVPEGSSLLQEPITGAYEGMQVRTIES